MIDDEHFFVRGCLEVPVIGSDDALSWRVWTSLSRRNFDLLQTGNGQGPFLGWLCSHVWLYPETLDLKARIHPREAGRPYVELEPTDHPLAVEQRRGISIERVADIYEKMLHGPGKGV